VFRNISSNQQAYSSFYTITLNRQIWSTLLFIYGAYFIGILSIDELSWKFMKPYLFYNTLFAFGIYANMRSLSGSNVETVIVFRSLSPLIVSFLDWTFLGREVYALFSCFFNMLLSLYESKNHVHLFFLLLSHKLPSNRSFISLSFIVLGAIGYANADEKFQQQGGAVYLWPTFYLFLICLEMAYGKLIVKSVELKTASGPVQYSNIISWIPMLVFAKFGGEYDRIHSIQQEKGNFLHSLPTLGLVYLTFGCIVGTCIGYTAWWCRAKVSAASFTLIGVMNKFLTIVLNFLIWDYHATPTGIACLCLCIVAGAFYEQAPMRKEEKKTDDYAKVEQGLEMKTSSDGADKDDSSSADTEPLLQQRAVKH